MFNRFYEIIYVSRMGTNDVITINKIIKSSYIIYLFQKSIRYFKM